LARRSRTILDDLTLLPWWVNVILAAVVYLSFKYLIPSILFQNPLLKGFARALPGLAPIFGGLILFVAGISAFNAWRKGQLLDRQTGIKSLRAISWQEFEELVGEAYRRKGYMVTETGGGGADGGVDLVLKRGGEKLLVQCKHWKMEKVGVKVVRELYGVVAAEGASGGMVLSSGTFTEEARNFARGKPLELLDGSELLNLIVEVQKEPRPLNKKPEDNICPLCGAEMVLRTAKRGPNAGEKFWGCSSFPKCSSTKPYKG
jgi:restriction system protein